jgi:hypothetical protein
MFNSSQCLQQMGETFYVLSFVSQLGCKLDLSFDTIENMDKFKHMLRRNDLSIFEIIDVYKIFYGDDRFE